MKKHASIRLLARTQAAGRARLFVMATLVSWGLRTALATAELVVSELVANALRHGAGTIEVALARTNHAIRVEVSDDAPNRLPRLRSAGADGGYGLHMIDAVAAQWGYDVDGEHKTVWAEIDPDQPLY